MGLVELFLVGALLALLLTLLGVLLLLFAAHDLLVGERIGFVGFPTWIKRDREAGNPRNGFVGKRGKETIQAEGAFPRFADDRLVSGEQVDTFWIGEEVLKEASVDCQPVDLSLKEALNGAVTGSFDRSIGRCLSG